MKGAGVVLAVALAPLSVLAEEWPVGEVQAPSGQPVVLHEMLVEAHPYSAEPQIVVRLLAPQIAQAGLGSEALLADMDWACATWGPSFAASEGAGSTAVVIEMMAAPVERGIATPEIRQVFETYRLNGATCQWEVF